MPAKRIFLIGYMGSGKTTIGKKLAEKLGLSFIDLDLFIENRHHKSVKQIFSEKGEPVFREIEHNALREVSNFENVIISTGGGAPCFYENMELMNTSGTTIYLKVSTDELWKRLENCKSSRPLLKDKSSEELKLFIASSVGQREAFYNKAKMIFDAEQLLTDTDVYNTVSYLIKYLSK